MMQRLTMNWMASAALALLVTAGTTAWILLPGGNRADPTNVAQVALGKAIYSENCASCHGTNLEGQPDWRERKSDGRMPAPPHNTMGHTWHHPDEVLFGIIKQGVAAFAPSGYESDMPAFGGVLTDEEIWAVLAYLKSSWPPEIQVRQSALKQ
ncbi:mono/diheme cytochrome c family protein [Skermanella aerolata]|uniref:c-type cytochrome n=1 Tax=Skermanella aerolata TaxID=393310 RepID=UPI003D1D3F00